MKKQCRISMIDKMKPLKNLQAIVLLAPLALLYTGCYPATLAPSEDNLRSKQLTPPTGKALVYFYLDHSEYSMVDVAVSLNGFRSRISENTYVLWEVFPGDYLLEFTFGAGSELEIQCEANQIYYYCIPSVPLFSISDKLGQASAATGRARINEFSLVTWFKDVPAPPETDATSGKEVASDVPKPAEPEKVEATARARLDEAVGTTKQAGSPRTDSDRVDKEELKSTKVTDKAQPIDSVVAEDTDSAPPESAQPGELSESTTIVTPVRPTSTPMPFAIKDPNFEAAYKGECDTDATITSVEGNSFGAGGQISIRNGAFVLWCYGAKHTWKGRLTYAGHVFDSDNESPLQFMVDKDKGYVYLGGKGTVTLPDGTDIPLPLEHTDESAAAPAGILDAPSPEKRDDVPTAQQARDSDKADTAESDEKDTEPPTREFGETDKSQPPVEVIGTIRLIMRKDSDVTVTKYLYSRYNPLQRTGSVTRDRFVYEPDADIKASLERAGFEVVSEDSNEPEDATLAVRYEEKKREPGLDSPTAYYFSFSLSHKTKGTLLEGSAKATGCDSAEELRNDPQFQNIGPLIRDAFVGSETGAAASEATANETAGVEEALSPVQRAGSPDAGSDGVAAGRSKSSGQARVPFSKERVVKIDGISSLVGTGEVSFETGQDANMLQVEISGKVKIINDISTCMFAVEKVMVAPNVKVPLSLFVEKGLGEHSGMKTLRKSDLKFSYALETVETSDGRQYRVMKKPPVREELAINGLFAVPFNVEDDRFLLAGPEGASLKKVDDGFILLEGEAYALGVRGMNGGGKASASVQDVDVQTEQSASHAESPDKGTIKIHFKASSARSRIGSDGKMAPVFTEDISAIEENIRSRLSKAGFRIIPEAGNRYDALLYIQYRESMSSVPQWGNTEYSFGFTLEDANGVKLLDEGSSSGWRWNPSGPKAFVDYVYLPDFIVAALKGEERISIFLPLLQEGTDIPRVLSILGNLKDPRAIEHITPILRHNIYRYRGQARRALNRLGYKPTSDKDKAAMEIVQMAGVGGQITRHQGIIRRYGIPAIELFLEDLRIQPPTNYIRSIPKNAVIALEVATKDTNQEWNDYTITRLIAGLNNIDEDVENKEQYIKDVIYLLGEIGDNRAIVALNNYLSDETFVSYAKTAMQKIKKQGSN